MASPREPSLAEGARVAGRYRIDGLIARGGMGAVYRAVDEPHDRVVALKLCTKDDGRVAEMFEREYHTLVSLRHPRIIEVYEYGVDRGSAYYTMELLDGSDLNDLAPVPFVDACRYLRDVASSLALLHARRLIHRDLTPRNVRVTSSGRCKLIDFGVLSSFGVSQILVGTPPFVAPEAVGGAPLDQRADLFGLGALSYWLLTGRHAYPARRFGDLQHSWQSPPVAPSVLRPTGGSEVLPSALDELVLALLSRNPLARPASAAEVMDRLTTIGGLEPDGEPLAAESYLSGSPTVGRQPEQKRLRSRVEALSQGIGSSIILEADPGLGSSHLLAELAVEAQLRGATPLVVDARRRAGVYGVILEVVDKLLEVLPEPSREAAAPHADVLSLLAPALFEGASYPGRSPPRLAPGELRKRTQTALADWLFTLAEKRALVIAVDDGQRLDDASAAVLATLAHQVATFPLLLAVAIKPGEPAAAPQALRTLRELSARMPLAPLAADDVEQLIRGTFGAVPRVGRLSDFVYRSSAGNPKVCTDVVRGLVGSGWVRHTEGIWVLPTELPEADTAAPLDPHEARLARLSPTSARLAEALSVHRGPVALERCIAAASDEGVANVWKALDELTREDVLRRTEAHYEFTDDRLRQRIQGRLDGAHRQALHRKVGEILADTAEGDVDAMLEAGFHLLRGGARGRGADLLSRAGLLLGYDSDEMGAAVAPLRAALEVYREEGRSPRELVNLLGPLCNAGWYCDRRLADEYGDEALALLSDLVGLTLAARLRPWLGKHLSLYVGLAVATARCVVNEGSGGIDSLRAMIVMYFNCVMAIGGVAIMCLDAERAEQVARKLEHLTALGKDHSATISHRFAVLLALSGRDHLAEAVAGYEALLARLESDRPIVDLPDDSRLMLIGGVHYALGIIRSFCDGADALSSAAALDDVGLELYAMVADQVRANHHACRGEIEQADYYRDRVEMHAIQSGSGWQAEIWAPASSIISSLSTGDIVGMKRASEELERLARDVPSLCRQAALARAGYLLMRDAPAEAREIFRSEMEGAAPRSFVGWGALLGAWARASNALGDHEEARRICQSTLGVLSAADLRFTAMYLILHLELAVAEASLGKAEAATRRIDALLDRYRDGGSPVTLAGLHRTRVLIALHEGDIDRACRHLEEMERAVSPTANPGLLQQCEALRARLGRLISREVPSPGAGAPSATGMEAPPELEGLAGAKRAERALELVTQMTGGQSGFLFETLGGEPTPVAPEGVQPPEHVVDQVRRDVQAYERNRHRASTEIEAVRATPFTTDFLAAETNVESPTRGYRSVLLSADDEHVVAAVAILEGDRPAFLSPELGRALARELGRRHDMVTETLQDVAPTARQSDWPGEPSR